jgi:hypothetical protein
MSDKLTRRLSCSSKDPLIVDFKTQAQSDSDELSDTIVVFLNDQS